MTLNQIIFSVHQFYPNPQNNLVPDFIKLITCFIPITFEGVLVLMHVSKS